MPATRTHLPDLLLTALAPLIWGSTYLVTTLFLPPERPFTAALLRVLPAGVLLLAAYRQMPARRDWGRIALLGVLNIGLFQAMLFVAAYRLTGGLAAILTSTQTLMVLLLTWLVGGQMPLKAAWAWAAAGVAGIGLLVLSPTARLDGLGVAAALAGSAAMALGVYLSKHWQIKLSGAAFTGGQLVAGGLFLLPITLWREGVPDGSECGRLCVFVSGGGGAGIRAVFSRAGATVACGSVVAGAAQPCERVCVGLAVFGAGFGCALDGWAGVGVGVDCGDTAGDALMGSAAVRQFVSGCLLLLAYQCQRQPES